MALSTTAPADWEAAWAPYDEATYAAALAWVEPDDVVLDIGAGDLRFARRAAARARRVVALERQGALLAGTRPGNLDVVCGDALQVPYPPGITLAVLLMRHCRHFAGYVSRLRAAGCWRLITNARWGMGVELVSLRPQAPFDSALPGWYACLCGAAGFKPGPPDQLTPERLSVAQNVEDCPRCGLARNAGP
jgi:SAM-dependent methyltransferase